ncbi:ATP-binding cassette domain-containing protein [Novosphingobium sp. 9]|uniref:ATP-binding cassette domain-containing protein n=1 Tax=Novosphingobium sp. 9 TaxID=2025349 RepID=UPI0021B65702|nr:ATP-binding cassette domain-containing protein [Novosphingobium sp. 9]
MTGDRHNAAPSMSQPPAGRFAQWLVQPMLENRAIYLKVALAAAMINLFGLASSIFSMTVYDRVVPNNATASLVGLAIGLAIIIVFDFVLRTLRAYFVDIAGMDIDRAVGGTAFQRLLALRMDLRSGSTGQLSGMMRELETLREFFASATMTALVDVPFILLTLAVIAAIGGIVVLVPLAMAPIVIGVGLATYPALDRLSARSMSQGLAKQAVLVETIGAIETVKTAGAGPLLLRRWLGAIDHHADSALRQRLVGAIGVNVATSAQTISYAGVIVLGVSLIAEKELTMGALIACSLLGGRAVAPLGQIAQLLSRLTATRAAYRQLDGLMGLPTEGPEGTPLRPASLMGEIEFRNVTFRYPGSVEKALDNVSFTIAPGEHVALLGRVGSGKSTIARMALGLYPPEEGMVRIDGTDLRQLDIDLIRSRMGAAMQESVLLTGTVRENIVLERDIDDEELLRIARISGTHDFMGRMANGYDLRLTDRGESLSGGQRQSISLARALAGKPPLVVFDEPTSAMDVQSETALIARLEQELKGRTLLLITHRPSLLRLVDRILIVEGGRIAADGPRDAMMQRANSSAAPAPAAPAVTPTTAPATN